MQAYVAVDIGASSGRLILATQAAGKLQLEEVHRFKNGFVMENGHERWQIDRLIQEILIGLGKIKARGIDSVHLGIDTWAVYYVLVGANGEKLQDPISYRDSRTDDAIEALCSELPKEYIYEKTGIQFLNFNTLYQLYREDHNLLQQADKILMIPDYLGFVLTGKAVTEVTNASTTQMLNLRQRLFDKDLMAKVQVRAEQFPKLVESGTNLGAIKPELKAQYDLPNVDVISVTTHDTASAVVGTPGLGKHWAFLSSGTWSLLGAELNTPENSLAAYQENYTNEWGAYGTYRFLKNIMGMWIVQCIKRDYHDQYSFPELAALAEQATPLPLFIDVNDQRFTNPDNMITAIQAYAKATDQPVPETPGQLVRAVYDNLALCYADAIQKLSEIIDNPIDTLNIVGGGANVALLNQMTADLAGVTVIAGPSEATAVGNIMVQMIQSGDVANIKAGRQLIADSFDLKTYEPKAHAKSSRLADYQTFMAKQHA